VGGCGACRQTRLAEAAGVFNNGPRMLRHTFCSHLAVRGAPARAIQELDGHQNLARTQRCMHPVPRRSTARFGSSNGPIAKSFVEIYWKLGIVKVRSRTARTGEVAEREGFGL